MFSDYEPALRFGWECAANPKYAGKAFEDVETSLANDWVARATGVASVPWQDVKPAVRDAWHRVRSR